MESSGGGALPRVALRDLPVEVAAIVGLIDAGGPFPHRKDGRVFGNRPPKGRVLVLLPIKPHGYYREYTVQTPRLAERGRRRVVTGRDGEIYYTEDHYETFVEMIAP